MRIRTKNSRGSGGMKHKGGTSAAAGTWAIESLWEKMESRLRETEETNRPKLEHFFMKEPVMLLILVKKRFQSAFTVESYGDLKSIVRETAKSGARAPW